MTQSFLTESSIDPHLPRDGKLSAREICVLSLLAALMFASKVALSGLPNIHLNAVFLILITVFFGWKALYTVSVNVLLEGLIYGFTVWWIGYLYAWPALVVVAMLFRQNRSILIWAVIHGLLFGPMMYLVYFLINRGWQMFFTMWVSGIPYDLAHCTGNFVLVLVLYRPLYKVMDMLMNRGNAQAG